MYKLKIKRAAENDLRRLPRTIFQRINFHILALQDNPYSSGVKKLQGNLVGWRIRVSNYRVVYTIDKETQMVTILRVRHRRDVYRP